MASKGEMTLLRYLHRMLLFLHLFQSIHRLKNPKLRINLLHPTRLLLPTTCRFHQLNRLDQIIAALLILLFKQRISLLHHLVAAVQVLLSEGEGSMTGEMTGEAEEVGDSWTIVRCFSRSTMVGSTA